MQLDLFEKKAEISNAAIELCQLFDAYFNCRSNKRNTANALAFEVDYENNLIELWRQINERTYTPGKSIVFGSSGNCVGNISCNLPL